MNPKAAHASNLNGSTAIFSALAARLYQATDDDIKALARTHLQADKAGKEAKNAYLRTVVAAIQVELGTQPRKAPARGKRRKLTAAVREQQAEALDRVHKHHYALVLEGITTPDVADNEKLPAEERTNRSLERNARSNFARTVKHVISKYIEAGGDITLLVVPTLQKSALDEAGSAGADVTDTKERLKLRIDKDAKRIENTVKELLEEDPRAAHMALEATIMRLGSLLPSFDIKTTSKPDIAIKQGLMLRTSSGVFYPVPTETQQ